LIVVVIAVTNISMSSVYIDWKNVGLFFITSTLFLLTVVMIKLLYRIVCCSSASKLKNIKAILENEEALSEESLMKILELNVKDLDSLSRSKEPSSTEILQALAQYRKVLTQEAEKSKILLADANHKMEKNIVMEGDMVIYTYSDQEWINYLEAKLNHEKKLLKIIMSKQNEIVDVCKLKGRLTDFDSFLQSYKGSTESCSICLSEYDKDSLIAVTDCSHHYHQQCLRRWILESASCPLCKCEV